MERLELCKVGDNLLELLLEEEACMIFLSAQVGSLWDAWADVECPIGTVPEFVGWIGTVPEHLGEKWKIPDLLG